MFLWNRTSCTKASLRLSVLPSNHSKCLAPPHPPPRQVPLQEGAELDCPDLDVAAKMADSEPTVTWFHLPPGRWVSEEVKWKREGIWLLSKTPPLHVSLCSKGCDPVPTWHSDLEQRGTRLHIHVMLDSFQGSFYCCVSYWRRSQELHFSRRLDLSAVCESASDTTHNTTQHLNLTLASAQCASPHNTLDNTASELQCHVRVYTRQHNT